jgi:hypothetical protein
MVAATASSAHIALSTLKTAFQNLPNCLSQEAGTGDLSRGPEPKIFGPHNWNPERGVVSPRFPRRVALIRPAGMVTEGAAGSAASVLGWSSWSLGSEL